MAETKQVAQNRKARHDFFVLQTFEAGIALHGTEVKSIRLGKANLKDSYASFEQGELFVQHMHVSPYEQGNIFNRDPLRKRKLLMRKSELRKLQSEVQQKGLTLVPLSMYLLEGKIKVELGLCQGKKNYDKRNDLALKDAKREMERHTKGKNLE